MKRLVLILSVLLVCIGLPLTAYAIGVVYNGNPDDVLVAEPALGPGDGKLRHLADAIYTADNMGDRILQVRRGADRTYWLYFGWVNQYSYVTIDDELYVKPGPDTAWWNMGELIPAGHNDID